MSGMDRLTELLPCPFCGGTEADGTIDRAHGSKYVMHSESDDCAAFRGVLIPTQHWNRRASQAAPAPVAWANIRLRDGVMVGLSEEKLDSWLNPVPLYSAPAPSDGLREARKSKADAARWRADCAILLAQLDSLEEATGEGPEGEDRALVEQIRAALTPAPAQDVS